MMRQPTMEGFRCWSAESVSETVFSDIGALSSDADAVFLAAHTPVELEHSKGPEFDTHRIGERQVLEALLQRVGDQERNTLVAVTGCSGSGKSHVVRWVHAHLDKSDHRYAILYVPRAVQTIRDLLRRIVQGLPGVDSQNLLNRVDDAISGKSPGEVQDSLVAQMRIDLNWTIEDKIEFDGETKQDAEAREDRNSLLGVRDDEGRRREGLADLLEVPAINRTLTRPDGALRQLVQSYFSETSRRDDNDQIFTTHDLPVREKGVMGSLSNRPDLAELWRIIMRRPDDALSLLEEALRAALPKTLGLRTPGGETLDALFRESRKTLRKQGRELVLVFEDLAQFGLVDGELYDQFVTPPGKDLAPLRVVFAVTDGAYGRMERTVRTRVEHEFRVGGAALADASKFVGRYLNLVRVGRESVQTQWTPEEGLDRPTEWVPNACDTLEAGNPCRFRDDCHAAFGAVEIPEIGEVGLYPYNATALRRAMSHLGPSPTPRDVLDQCISTNLAEADSHIERGTYPHERTRNQFDFFATLPKDAVLSENPSSDPERTYRAVVIWGDEHALPGGVLTAFSLGGDPSSSAPQPQPTPTVSDRRPEPDEPSPLLPLFQWQNGAELPEGEVNYFRSTLYRLTATRLNLDQHLSFVHGGRGKEILDSLFKPTSFSLEGARGRPAGAGVASFELGRTAQDVQLLTAARWFREHGHFNPSSGLWPWPGNYDPARLLVALETQLDAWAREVRERFLDVTGGSILAQRAVGIRALALAAIGRRPADIASTMTVLNCPTDSLMIPSGAWEPVESMARRALTSVKADEYVAEFASVRQGDTGRPQIVDTFELETALTSAYAEPQDFLAQVAGDSTDPILQQAARGLLDALRNALPAERLEAASDSRRTAELLEDGRPPALGSRAFEIGRSARGVGLFRPSEGWNQFQHATDLLTDSSRHVEVDDLGQTEVDLLLRQHDIRGMRALRHALEVVNDAMTKTRLECERSSVGVADVARLRGEVQDELRRLTQMVKRLSSGSKQ